MKSSSEFCGHWFKKSYLHSTSLFWRSFSCSNWWLLLPRFSFWNGNEAISLLLPRLVDCFSISILSLHLYFFNNILLFVSLINSSCHFLVNGLSSRSFIIMLSSGKTEVFVLVLWIGMHRKKMIPGFVPLWRISPLRLVQD